MGALRRQNLQKAIRLLTFHLSIVLCALGAPFQSCGFKTLTSSIRGRRHNRNAMLMAWIAWRTSGEPVPQGFAF